MAPTLASLLSHPLRLGDLQVAGPITLAPLLGGPAARLSSLDVALRGGAEARELPTPEVTEIVVRNPTPHALLLVDGEEIVGARQNRIVDGTCVVPAGAERVVRVCCVERQRWDAARSADAFTSSTQVMSPALRAVKSRTARETGRGDQRAVWAQVERTIEDTSTATATRAVTDVFTQLGPRLDEVVSAFRLVDGQVGMIVGVEEKVWAVDYVADPRAFAAMFPRLLRGYAVDVARGRRPAALSAGELALALQRLMERALTPAAETPYERTLRFAGAGLPVEGTVTMLGGDVVAIDALLPAAPAGAVALERPAMRTSETHPIAVDWLPVADVAVGLTFAPGKRARSFGGAPWVRDLDMDLVRLREHHRVDALVCLLSDRELAALSVPDYEARVTHHGFALHRLALRDGHVPSSMAAVRRLLAGVLPRVRRGERVVVHCRGGLGRAGTIAGCLLVELGLSSADALIALEARDPRRCPENQAQRGFIHRYASSMRRRVPA